jgi:hypothetical protein
MTHGFPAGLLPQYLPLLSLLLRLPLFPHKENRRTDTECPVRRPLGEYVFIK